MKRRNKIALLTFGLLSVGLLATGCTANFCTEKDKAKIAYAFEPGISEFVVSDSVIAAETGKEANLVEGNVYQVVYTNVDENGNFVSYKKSTQLTSIISSAKSSGYLEPSIEYFKKVDVKVLNQAVAAYNAEHEASQVSLTNITQEKLDEILSNYGFVKFYKNNNAYNNYRAINDSIRSEDGYTKCASLDFESFYISSLDTVVSKYHSCITVYDEVNYGNYNGSSIRLEKVTWKEAWGKGGHLIEGLIVYPVAWLIDTFAVIFAGGKHADPASIAKAYQSGSPQILSIIVVTVIVRLFIFLVTFKTTIAQKKMADLQPELAKIQQKYPNSNTNQAQKQRLAEEQMRLYKKHKVNPLSQLLVIIIQFPIFIGVWGAMTGSAVLSTGTFLNLDLSGSIWEALKVGPKGHAGWWTALVLILLMSASQFFSMKVPQWIQKAKQKKVARLGKNPAQKQQNRTANIISYVMLIMIVIMGFTLPSAMGVYWFVGAIVSLIQTVFTNVIFAKKN